MQQLHEVLHRRAPSAAWHSSDEPKAIATAQSLTTGPVRTWPALREAHRSDWFATHEEFHAAVLDAFNEPARSARPGWEPLTRPVNGSARRSPSSSTRRSTNSSLSDTAQLGRC